MMTDIYLMHALGIVMILLYCECAGLLQKPGQIYFGFKLYDQ